MHEAEIIFKQLFKGSTTVLGKQLTYPKHSDPQIEFWKVTLPPNSVGDWHEHLVPEFFYVECGELYVVNRKDEEFIIKTFKAGDSGLTDLLVPQFIWNPGDSEVITFAIYIGDKEVKPTRYISPKPEPDMLRALLLKK